MTLTLGTIDALRALQHQIGRANTEKGFHEEGKSIRSLPRLMSGVHHPLLAPVVNTVVKLIPAIERNYWTARLALLTTEVAEAIEELRNGRAVDLTYYPTNLENNGAFEGNGEDLIIPKPEGVPSEIADVVIRAFDFADEAGIDLATIIEAKLTYNASRPKMHGRKF